MIMISSNDVQQQKQTEQKKSTLTRVQRPTLAMSFVTDDIWPRNKRVSRTHQGTFLCQVWWSAFDMSCGITDKQKSRWKP